MAGPNPRAGTRHGVALAACLAMAPTLCQAGSVTQLYAFKGGADGGWPTSPLIHLDGKFFGTTHIGGAQASGTIFTVQPDGHHVALYSFAGGTDGAGPYGGLVALNGVLYGTTQAGGGTGCGGGGCGTIYAITPQGHYTQLYAFQGAADGYLPNATLVVQTGLLYGTTRDGGANNGGVAFSVSLQGTETTLHAFRGKPDGAAPNDLITDGTTLYGTTAFGGKGCGSSGCGTLFTMDPQGNETILYAFSGDDGSGPMGRLLNSKGRLYGTTIFGGAGYGTVFSVSRSGKQRLLHVFDDTDGSTPYAGLTDLDGTLYGTTSGGGTGGGAGTIFSITPQGDFSTLYDFQEDSGGDSPVAELLAYHGRLYGTTSFGGKGRRRCESLYCGTVFAVIP